jgi:hypothetical protein
MRSNAKGLFIAPLLTVWPLAAGADDGEAAKLIAECSVPELPQASVDSCLERVRVLEETEPSSRLQSLEGALEEREAGRWHSARAVMAPSPPAAMSAPPDSYSRSAGVDDKSVAENRDEDGSQPPPGSQMEDEPPVADPPDAPFAGDRSSDEQLNDPRLRS